MQKPLISGRQPHTHTPVSDPTGRRRRGSQLEEGGWQTFRLSRKRPDRRRGALGAFPRPRRPSACGRGDVCGEGSVQPGHPGGVHPPVELRDARWLTVCEAHSATARIEAQRLNATRQCIRVRVAVYVGGHEDAEQPKPPGWICHLFGRRRRLQEAKTRWSRCRRPTHAGTTGRLDAAIPAEAKGRVGLRSLVSQRGEQLAQRRDASRLRLSRGRRRPCYRPRGRRRV